MEHKHVEFSGVRFRGRETGKMLKVQPGRPRGHAVHVVTDLGDTHHCLTLHGSLHICIWRKGLKEELS